MTQQRIFITGTMRTGSSLVSNALSVHSKIIVMSDRVHFFRFIWKRYEPLTEHSVHKMLLHQRARLYYRFSVEMDVERIYHNILKRGITYTVIYEEIMRYYLERTGKKIWGDDPALAWREIPFFARLFEKPKIIHIIRDPRAIMTSWKRSSGLPNDGYLNSLFNWIDSANHMKRYRDSLSPDVYFPLRYEDISTDPVTWIKKLCDFLEVEFEEIMIQPDRWASVIGDNLVPLGSSSYEGKVTGFSHKRTNRWKDVIEPWETLLAEALAGNLLRDLGYELMGNAATAADFAGALERFRKNDFLLKQLLVYLGTGEGTNRYPLDPTDYRSWGAPHDPSQWFKDCPVAQQYLAEIDEINKRFDNKQ